MSSLTRPPQPLPHHHRHHHHRPVNPQSLNHQIQKVTGVKRRRNTVLHMETNGKENGEACSQQSAVCVEVVVGSKHFIKIESERPRLEKS